jgi:hypothetical protein
VHYNDSAYKRYIEKIDTQIRPLQAAGIKVLMGIVPQDDGVCIGVLGDWPMEDVWPWAANNNGEDYIYNETVMKAFAKELADELKLWGLDGVGYDEEYANRKSTPTLGYPGSMYPSYSGQAQYTYTATATAAAAWQKGGANMFRFGYELQKQFPAVIQEVYEIRYGEYLPKTMELDGKTVKVEDLFSASYSPYYGSWDAHSAFLPDSKYGPVPMDIGGGETVKPSATSITSNMNTHLKGGYGVNMFYGLGTRVAQKANVNFFGKGIWDLCNYLSKMSMVLYGERTIYTGPDIFDED